MPGLKKIENLSALDARGVSRALKVLRREAPSWNAPIVSFIAVQHRDPFRTLISCILSLRTKDATTAAASTRLFARAQTPSAIVALSPKTIERLIFPVGFYRTKARVIRGICRDLIEKFDGRVPDEIDALLTLKGVGRKTAERMVLELRDKLPEAAPTAPAIPTLNAVEEDVLSALINLGYQRAPAEKILAAVVKEGSGKSFDQIFRAVLGRLSK